MRPRAVIYDHDGTLIDSLDLVVAATNGVLADLGVPALPRDEVIAGMVHPTGRRMGLIVGEEDSEAQARLATAFYDRAFTLGTDHARVYPGIADLVVALAAAGLSQGVVTNNQGRLARRILAHLGLSHAIAVVVGEEDMPAPKPDPRGLVACARRLGVEPAEAIYVGDTVGDLDTARAAGMPCIGVTWGITPRNVLEQADFFAVVDEPEEIAQTFA